MSARRIQLVTPRRLLAAGLCCWVLMKGGAVCAQSQGSRIIEVQPVSMTARLLPARLGQWQLNGSVLPLSHAAFVSSHPERGQLLGEYGLRDVAIADYQRADGRSVRVEIFRLIHFVAAYGAYSLERSIQAQPINIGTEGAVESNRLSFFKGEYYVCLTARSDAIDSATLIELARRLDERIAPRHSEIPILMQHIPSESLLPGTQRFIAGPLALNRLLGPQEPYDPFMLASEAVEAALAEYQVGGVQSPLLIVEYHTPQLAAAAYPQVQRAIEALPEAERSRRLLKREGNYIIVAFNVNDRQAMQAIVDQVDYTPTIHWLKKSPLEMLRELQPDPEQISLIDTYLAAFAFIGLSLLVTITGGVLLGTAIFFWRRWRRRNWEGFTDAGGMMRLNLDNLLPPIDEDAVKRLPGK
ncbi:MAG: DUF6599 family protein [Acidobacteriota bacterium]|nr:hypothetical protein [Blastocatellia bacterium]MDW8238099.1 DUF6599 family protein [Acidobacteriota bacterium]